MLTSILRPLSLARPLTNVTRLHSVLARVLPCRTSSLPLRRAPLRHASTGNASAPKPTVLSSQTAQGAPVTPRAVNGRALNKYPERLLIFHSPTSATVWIGFSKAVCIGFFGFGVLMVAPNVYFNEDAAPWLAPLILLASPVPMILISLLTSPFLASVFIRLPPWARRSAESLQTFARRLPADTRLEVQKIGFLPLPRTRAMQLSDLGSVRTSRMLVNLEHVPSSRAESKKSPATWERLAHYYLFARPTPSHWQRTPAPFVWPLVWDQIQRNSIAGAPAAARKVSTTPAAPARPQQKAPLPSPAVAVPPPPHAQRSRPRRKAR
ncbi:hypothetical protein AAFC00_006396 [Neodothiora populina]|uniref:Uncharacterized protein n=1 Tax=Neodothiora populina TaxID=2781224 RepID=A0ABR3P5E9_9PEZI